MKKECFHQHLVFQDDFRKVACMDCSVSWERRDGGSQFQVFGDETRHSKWVQPKSYSRGPTR